METATKQIGKKERNYGIDLLRIVSMFMVVILHVLGEGGVLSNTGSLTLKGELAWFIEIACYCAVNCYALISGYVAINSKRKWRTFISLWFQVFFYCFTANFINIIYKVIQHGFGAIGFKGLIKAAISSFLPALSGQYWYFTAYTALFLCMPIINHIVHTVDRRLLKASFLSLTAIFYIGERWLSSFAMGSRDGYSFLWLALIYAMGGYIAKYDSLRRLSVAKSMLGYLICILLTFFVRMSIQVVIFLAKGYVVTGGFESLVTCYTAPTITLAAVFLLNAFRQMRLGSNLCKAISLISPLTFGVYVIHCNPLVWLHLTNRFAHLADYPVLLMLLCVIGYAAAIFLVCMLLDYFRLLLFKLLKVNKLALYAENKIERISQKIIK